MFRKINNSVLACCFLAVLFVPLLFTRWESGGVSEEENRNLAQFPSFVVDGSFNLSFTKEFETWFMDHMGFRQKLITANKSLMQDVFDRSLTTSDWKIGKTGDSIYAPDAIVRDFAHANLRSAEEVAKIGNSYQAISDWLEERGILFYYVQCVDKHTVYPERFISYVKQLGDISKTDQVLEYLQNETTVSSIYFKQPLLDNKTKYDVFSHWGDPTHWTHRGAYISYRYMMEQINNDLPSPLKILTESDYHITYQTNYSSNNESEQTEVFTIQNPKAQRGDVTVMEQWAEDHRHSVWKNPEVGNDKRLLVMGDSYFNNYLIDDIAESFGEVWLIWGDYTANLPEIVELYNPDIVIYECAERVDRSSSVCNLSQELLDAEP